MLNDTAWERGRLGGQRWGLAPGTSPGPALAQPSPLPGTLRYAHLSCRFQALPRTSMWDMDGEDFREPGKGGEWSVSGPCGDHWGPWVGSARGMSLVSHYVDGYLEVIKYH